MMCYRTLRRLRILKTYSIGWTLAFLFLCIIRGVGTVEIGEVQCDFTTGMIMSLTLGPVFGLIAGCVQILMEERMYRRMSIHKLMLIRLFFSIVFLAIVVAISFLTTNYYFDFNISLKNFIVDAGSYAVYFYILVFDFVMALLRQVNLMLGEDKLSKLMLGKFYSPSEEERIFMFLDLQSSTQLAEKLGHIKYSKLLQDCFNDLAVVVENQAEIYQYVGDEVVLTWTLKNGLKRQNCLDAFFQFKQELKRRESHYQEKYDCLPFFKAGVNAGPITITEVGKYKKEIAYHGDTINTAARIQGMCNALGQELLVTENLMEQLNQEGYWFKPMGQVSLKGKEHTVSLFAALPMREQVVVSQAAWHTGQNRLQVGPQFTHIM